jgi:hypothetical protein
MAETYTDSKGVVFPLNPFGRPSGFFDGNTFRYPNFGSASAAATPAVDPTPVVTPLALPAFRLPSSVGLQQYQDTSGGGMPDTPPATSQFGVSPDPSVGTGLAGGGNENPSNVSTTVGSGGLFGGINPYAATSIGERAGNFFGPPALGVLGGIVGGMAGGRGGRGIAGNAIASTLGTLALGPIGGLLGLVGGRIGDVLDMEDVLGMQTTNEYPARETRGFFDTLGYGFGFGRDLDEQMIDYYGLEEAAEIDADIDPYAALSDAFGPGDMVGDMGEAFDESDPGEMGDDF